MSAISCPFAARLCSSSMDPFPLTAFIPMCVRANKSISLAPSSWVVKCHAGRTPSALPSTRTLGLRKPQEPLRVEMTDLLLLRRAEGGRIQEGSSLLIRAEGIIDREHDSVGPHHLPSEQERWIGEETAGRKMEVVQKVVRHRLLQLLFHEHERVIDARQQERNHLSHLPNNPLE